MTDRDILIAGGGIAGLIATASFAHAGFDVICCDPAPRLAAQKDLRSTAFLNPSIDLLSKIGVWRDLQPDAAELRIMRLADAGGAENELRYTADFDASELGAARFGWNVPNWRLRETLIGFIESNSRAELRFGSAVTDVLSRMASCRATLSDGTGLKPKLVLAADGRNSALREAAGIKAHRTRFGQKALVFTVTHPNPHKGVSTEIHRTGGPFTLVPLPDSADGHASAVVWMENGPEASRLNALPDAEFKAAINHRACGVLGPLTLSSPRAIWPIIAQRAEQLVAGRIALIAEAAHVVPPIGAQGLNMSIADISCLLDLSQAKSDPGASDLLDRYERQRLPEITRTVRGVSLLNRAAQTTYQPMRDMRLAGLKALFENPALRQTAMQAGLGI